jgi:acetolactate synthase I/II/III large subunit
MNPTLSRDLVRGADHLASVLANSGVTRIFSLSGNQIMPVYDACIDAGIEIVHVRHEAAAVFMADAWAQLTGRIGVALVTAAPGAANAVGPLYTARQSESPVLFLTGDSPHSQDGCGAFQELDQVAMTAPLTKRSMRVSSPSTIGEDVANAIQLAMSGRPGPVHLALPFDVLNTRAAAQNPVPTELTPRTQNENDVAAVLDAVSRASTPLIVTSGLCSPTRAPGLLNELSIAIAAPAIAMESPRGVKDPSFGDLAAVLHEADLIVSVGKPVDFTLGFGAASADRCRWIVVDADAAQLERAARNLGAKLITAIRGEPRAFAGALIELAAQRSTGSRDWLKRATDLLAHWRPAPEPPAAQGGTITSQMLCEAVDAALERAGGERIAICDGGEFGQWAQALVRSERRLINGPSGAIGGALCYAIAARLAVPSARIVALMGDGTVGFHFAEFETALREHTPFVVVIGNDGRWNAEHQIQLRDYGRDRLIGCELSGARYDLAVSGLGGHGEYVTNGSELPAALDRAFRAERVACVNVKIDGRPAPSGSAH